MRMTINISFTKTMSISIEILHVGGKKPYLLRISSEWMYEIQSKEKIYFEGRRNWRKICSQARYKKEKKVEFFHCLSYIVWSFCLAFIMLRRISWFFCSQHFISCDSSNGWEFHQCVLLKIKILQSCGSASEWQKLLISYVYNIIILLS